MATVKKIENKSLFEVKEDTDCIPYGVSEELNSESGDSINPCDSNEYQNAKKSAEKFVQTYSSKTPSDYTEVDEDTLIHYFGKDWSGYFPDCKKVLERRASYASTQLQWYNTAFDYITNQNLVPSGSTKYSNILAQISGNYSGLFSSINGINSCIRNLKNFKFSTENPMAILKSTEYAYANLKYMFTQVKGLTDYSINTYKQLEQKYGPGLKKSIDFVKNMNMDNIKDLANNLGGKVKEIADNIAKNLASLPATLMNKFLNCSFVQNMFTLPLRVFGFVMSSVQIIMTIRMPTNIADVMMIYKTLKKAVSEMKNAVKAIKNAINQIKQVAKMIKSGNWYGMLGMLKTTGPLPGFKIVEKPSSFAAKYPENSAYTTAGGHTLEIDNTEGHERLHVEHKSGTSFEMATSGDLLGKVKHDMQTIVDGNCEFATKGNMHLQANKKLDMTFNELNVEVAKDINFSGANIVIAAGTSGNFTSINSPKILMTSKQTTTISSAHSTTISSKSTLELSSNNMMLINSPKIRVVSDDILITTRQIVIKSQTFTSMAGSVTIMQSDGQNELLSNGRNLLKAPVTIIGR